MSIEWSLFPVWELLKKAVILFKCPVKYVMSSESFADDLLQEVRKLENEGRRVDDMARMAINNRRIFNDCFTEWQLSAEKALMEARYLSDAFDKASKTCCYGTLPDPYCRYHFSTKAKAEIQVIRELAQNCIRFRAVDDICSIDPSPRNVVAPIAVRREGKDVIELITGVFESRALMMREIMDALANNSNSVVGVYGMGGVGKSTLLKEFERNIRIMHSFDLVAKANVSENPDIETIQGEIADALGLTEIKNKETISGRANLLHGRLENEEREKRKVLIILDDLWEGLDLNKVGIPCGLNNKVRGCKLLLTSRDRNVLRSEMGCDKDLPLGELEEEEAKSLFERLVGDKVHDEEFKPLVDEALQKCAGLPFLILAVAKEFKHADLSGWRDALNQIEGCTNIGTSAEINKSLQLSYDHLKSEDAKSLLQLCAAYSVSEPSFENLVRYGFGLGIIQKDGSMEKARDRLSTLISTLQASSLLLYNEGAYGFKIHHLVRGFVAHFISRDHPLLVLKDKSMTELPKDKLKSCRAICFPNTHMEKLPEELDCPELQIFLLFSNNESLEVPDSYFNSMRKLAVLNLTSIRLTRSLMPFQFSENLRTLCLQRCSLEDVAILGKLKRLQILSIADSKIQRMPKEIGELVELRLLDLSHCSQLEIIEPGVLRKLIKLEELYMENSFHQWNAVEQTPPTNTSLIELNSMKNLCTLHVFIPNSSVLPKDLNFEQLTKYKIQIGNAQCWSEYEGLRKLEMKLNPTSDIFQNDCIQSLLGKTDDLFLDGLDKSEQSIWALSQEGFPKLKHLWVKNSPSVHYILQSPSHIEFETLESLLLENLINLEKICTNNISFKSLSALKVVRVECCHKMELLFPLSSVRELPQLEEIEVVDCKVMRGIVEADDCGEFEMRNLHILKLCDLPDIKNFVTTASNTSDDPMGTQIAFFNGQQVAFPNLETLYIGGMDNIEMIWDNQVTKDSFHKLKSLCVHECKRLKFVWDVEFYHQVKFELLRSISISRCARLTTVFSASVATYLMQLQELRIDECDIAKLIKKEEGSVPMFVFPNLTSLELKHLIELKCLYTGTHTSHWPALKTLKVDGCNKVEILASQAENEMPRHKQSLFLIEKCIP